MAKRVLLADDSANARGILRFMFQSQGFEIIEAVDGEDALAKAASSLPDLIVLDGMMPRKSGFDVCRELKQDPTTRSIPVILLSAIAQADPGRDWSREAPADRFISKPFQMRELLVAIEFLMGAPTASQTARYRKTGPESRSQGSALRQKNLPR